MKVGNALFILYFFMNCSTSNGRTERISRNDLQQRANESGHRRHLKKSKSHSTDEDPEQKLDSETQTPVSAPPVSPPTQSTPKSKKLDDRHKLGKGKKRKVPKKDTDTRSKSKSKKLDHRYGLDKDKKKGAKKSKNCPSIEEDEPSSSSSVKRSKTLSKGKGNKVSSPVKSPTQSALRSKKLEDRYYLGKGKKTKVHKEDIETDCSDSEDNPPSSVLPPIPQTSPPSPVASPVSTSSPLASSISTSKPAPPPTRVPSIPETQTSTPTSAPQPETAAPTLAPSKSPNAPPIQRPVAPPVPRPVAPPPVPRPVAPPPVSAGGFETTLNLENVADRFKSSFIAAATIWDSVIMGDMSDVVVDASVLNSPNLNCDSSLLPGVIDDIFICATVAPIDGENGILGIAGPSFFRFEDTITATIGFMNFDEADMDLQLELGTLEGLILHEMAHVYGFGTMWDLNGLAKQTVPCPYKSDSRASEQYRKLSGCDAPIPVESNFGAGTQCLHWDESCFLGELMTGSSSDGLELSILTIAALDDLGYTVDYSKADPFDTSKMSPDCVCNRRHLRGTHDPDVFSYHSIDSLAQLSSDAQSGSHNRIPPLSEEGNRIARAYGMSVLNANHEWKKAYLRDKQAELYIGDQIIVVLYMENGHKYTVMVKR